MKTHILIALATMSFNMYAQNIIVNGNFETGSLGPWSGYANQVLTDDITNSLCGNDNNGDSSTFQVFSVTEGTTYDVAFDYRWVSGSGTYNMNVVVKDGATGGSNLGLVTLNTTPDVWYHGIFSFTVPTGVTQARIIFYKATGNRPLRMDNVYVAPQGSQSGFIDPNTPINVQPVGVSGDWDLDFSDEFNDASLNTSKWTKSVSSSSRGSRTNLGVNDWWWKPENAFLDGSGNLVLRGTKVDNNTMYCGSVESRDLYEPTYGYLEARIQIAETAKGNHTAFWLQGHNQGNVDNSSADGAEVDIVESAWLADYTKAVVHFDGYGTYAKNYTIQYNTPNLHAGYHIFGLYWTETSMDIYYDGTKVTSTNPSKPFPFTVDSNGYALVPQVPEWLWLSVGASFADGDFQSQPVGTLSDALVDYVRVYKQASTLGVKDVHIDNAFNIYPNPAVNKVTIQSNEPNYTLHIYDSNGRLIMHSQKSTSTTIDVSGFAKGLYVFKMISNQSGSIHKIVIN